jgi:hypothetical protein
MPVEFQPAAPDIRKRNSMNAPDPSCKMALVGKARHRRNVRETELVRLNQFDGALQSKIDDETVRASAGGLGEYA